MKFVKSVIQSGTQFFAKYPAVLSGYIIYAYLFVSIIRLFLKVKYGDATLSDAFDIFSALPFMWLLAVALVKVIEFQKKLHETQTHRLHDLEELRTKGTQLRTMKEVVTGLQHHVNNPLAIITLYLFRLRRKVEGNVEALNEIKQMDVAAKRISAVLSQLSIAEHYEVQHAGPMIGNITVPAKHSRSAAV